MESLLIKGGVPLHGEVTISGKQKCRAAHHGRRRCSRTNHA
ncbi:MAG: hypothetical protein WDM76_12250 [Limisphaerales bacterium]